MENDIDCESCDGLGYLENWWGCSDPDCCGTNMCYPCDGTGRMEIYVDTPINK